MGEVATADRLACTREFERANSDRILEVLRELFPTWNWRIIPGEEFDPEHESRAHFLQDNPLHDEFSGDASIDEKLITDMTYQSVLFYMCTSEEELLEAYKRPRLYYNLEGVERLLVVYRAWARLNSSDSEYERLSSLVTSCFLLKG